MSTNYNDLITINHRNSKKLFKTLNIPSEEGRIDNLSNEPVDIKNHSKNQENTLLSTNDSNNESFDSHFKSILSFHIRLHRWTE
jgi:hypothetical protein